MTTATLHTIAANTPGLPCTPTPGRIDFWFSNSPRHRKHAARLCRTCPLVQACADYARRTLPSHGIWGGLDATQLHRKDCGTDRGYRAHRRYAEPSCDACQSAHDDVVEAGRRERLAVEHEAGGTVAGYELHRRLGEEACPGCKRALATRSKEARRARARERAQAAGAAPTPIGSRATTDPAPGAPAGAQPASLAA